MTWHNWLSTVKYSQLYCLLLNQLCQSWQNRHSWCNWLGKWTTNNWHGIIDCQLSNIVNFTVYYYWINFVKVDKIDIVDIIDEESGRLEGNNWHCIINCQLSSTVNSIIYYWIKYVKVDKIDVVDIIDMESEGTITKN